MPFDVAMTTYLGDVDTFNGIGFIFTEDDPYMGIDLDSINKWYGWREIVKKIDSYTELSPSNNGLHIICEGFVPGETHSKRVGGHETGGIEMWDNKHFITITLDAIKGRETVRKNQEAINWLYKSVDDNELMRQITKKEYRDKFIALWEGNWKGLYPSQSEAELGFVRILSNNKAPIHQIDRLYRKSNLARQKWDEKRGNTTYGMMTLETGTTNQNF
jgi:primase-polymerase (primpol)-like protein